ncbi:NAD(P)/FAD-dependent oxidoreductase [Candidatus Dependentiae bacterium]|nr:NAD(P)/FAD-dependent oxidoreductase [Candidatus Dependentiae bacterium]
MKSHKYDLVIIGGGSAGLVAAKFAAGIGKKVALIEKENLGGTCTWTGCIPSKTLIRIAQIAHSVKHLEHYGLGCAHTMHLDTSSIMTHVQKTIKQVYATHTPQELEKAGITVFKGAAFFINAHEILVGTTKLYAKKVIIATGTEPFIPSIEGLDQVPYLTNSSLFNLKELPPSLIILGAGPIGIEMASALNRLGVKITVIEMAPRILSKEDPELTELLTKKLEAEGVIVLTAHTALKVTKDAAGITVICKNQAPGFSNVVADSLLIAVGRKPVLSGFGLENTGVKTTPKNIPVSATMQTNIRHIYACGDIVGPYQFSHMAEYQAVIAARNALLPFFKKKADYNQRIWVTFTEPELASAGLSEQEARAQYGDSIKIYRYDYKDIDRAKTDVHLVGMAKFICDKKGYILGVHILGTRAGELIHEVQLGKLYSIKFTRFYSIIHAYPTYSEVIWKAAKKAYIDDLQSNKFLRFMRWLFGYQKK